jgi:hypothetical protein
MSTNKSQREKASKHQGAEGKVFGHGKETSKFGGDNQS